MPNPLLEYEIWQEQDRQSSAEPDYAQLYQQIRTSRANAQHRLLMDFVNWLTNIGQRFIQLIASRHDNEYRKNYHRN